MDIEKLKKRMEDIAGQWDGDNDGIEQERADIANDVLGNIAIIEVATNEINKLLEELNEL